MPWIVPAIAAVGNVATAKIKANSAAIGMGSGMQAATDARTNEIVFDNSGWNVNFGAGDIDSTATKSVEQSGASPSTSLAQSPYGMLSSALGLPAMNEQSMLIYAAIAGVFLIAWKRKKA